MKKIYYTTAKDHYRIRATKSVGRSLDAKFGKEPLKAGRWTNWKI